MYIRSGTNPASQTWRECGQYPVDLCTNPNVLIADFTNAWGDGTKRLGFCINSE